MTGKGSTGLGCAPFGTRLRYDGDCTVVDGRGEPPGKRSSSFACLRSPGFFMLSDLDGRFMDDEERTHPGRTGI